MNIFQDICYFIVHLIYCVLEAVVLTFIPRSLRYKSIRGKLILITGGGNGIGRAMAVKFSEFGATIVIWDIDKKGKIVNIYSHIIYM